MTGILRTSIPQNIIKLINRGMTVLLNYCQTYRKTPWNCVHPRYTIVAESKRFPWDVVAFKICFCITNNSILATQIRILVTVNNSNNKYIQHTGAPHRHTGFLYRSFQLQFSASIIKLIKSFLSDWNSGFRVKVKCLHTEINDPQELQALHSMQLSLVICYRDHEDGYFLRKLWCGLSRGVNDGI